MGKVIRGHAAFHPYPQNGRLPPAQYETARKQRMLEADARRLAAVFQRCGVLIDHLGELSSKNWRVARIADQGDGAVFTHKSGLECYLSTLVDEESKLWIHLAFRRDVLMPTDDDIARVTADFCDNLPITTKAPAGHVMPNSAKASEFMQFYCCVTADEGSTE